jgi:hypothetical protein
MLNDGRISNQQMEKANSLIEQANSLLTSPKESLIGFRSLSNVLGQHLGTLKSTIPDYEGQNKQADVVANYRGLANAKQNIDAVVWKLENEMGLSPAAGENGEQPKAVVSTRRDMGLE